MLPAVAFLLGVGTDQSGRDLVDYLSFTPERWEECHDHMQWAFPTETRSAYNPDAPVIPDDFHTSDLTDAQFESVQYSLELLLYAYLKSLNITVEYNTTFGYTFVFEVADLDVWASTGNHNLLRMTRVLECLGRFGLCDLQQELFDFLMYCVLRNRMPFISSKTVAFWVAAKENKLYRLR